MRALVIATVLTAGAALASAQPVGTAFTYQGRLTDAGNPPTAAYDLQLALFDAVSGGAQVGATLTRDDVAVTNGLFTVSLDFGAVFAGSKRWLEIRVRPGASAGAYTALAGRQELTPSPNAAFASGVPWAGVANKPAGFADDIDNDSGGDITSVAAGFGLTGGGTTGNVTLNANVAGNGSAATLARSDHDHFAQVWNGASSNGLTVANASSTGVGVHGQALATSGDTRGVLGEAASVTGVGVYGTNASGGSAIVGRTTATAGGNAIVGITEGASGIGVTGAALTTGWAVYGSSQTTSGTGAGVYGVARSPQATAGFFQNTAGGPAIVLGGGEILFSDGSSQSTAALGDVTGVAAGSGLTGGGTSGDVALGVTFSGSGVAAAVARSDHNHLDQAWIGTVHAQPLFRITNTATSGFSDAIWGQADGAGGGRGVVGYASALTGTNFGVWGQADSSNGRAVFGLAPSAAYAGYFDGRVQVTGTLSKGGGAFKIDHPLDPENKYLYHSFVESPDMKNIYDGVVTTDGDGAATVELPDWFQALNRDFRYQLTVIGRFAQAIVAKEIEDNAFTIGTSAPHVKVSWQVTGIRRDRFAEKHRIPVEEDKPEAERGRYLHPEEHGQPKESGLDGLRVHGQAREMQPD